MNFLENVNLEPQNQISPDFRAFGLVSLVGAFLLVLFIAQPEVRVSGFSFKLLLSAALNLSALSGALLCLSLIGQLFPRESLRAAVSGLLFFSAIFFILLDNLYFTFGGRHLWNDDIELIALAVQSGQFELSPSSVWLCWGGLIIWLLFWPLILKQLSRVSCRSLNRSILTIGVISTLVLFLLHRNSSSSTYLDRELERAFLWSAFTAKSHSNPILELAESTVTTKAVSIEDSKLDQLYAELQREFLKRLPVISPAKNKPNVLMVVVEGLRSDMFNAENMPQLYESKADWLVLPNHYSSGANSGTGDFGAVSGLSALYYASHRNSESPILPFELLKALGYKLSLYFTKSMRYDRVYENLFERSGFRVVQPSVRDEATWDKLLVESYNSELGSEPLDRLRFDFLRLNVTHFNYYYPPQFEHFTPAATSALSLASGRKREFEQYKVGLKNRYFNSVLYADSLISELVNSLKALKRWDNTVVVIIGDHGEEFWEKGSFGHSFGLNNEQIKTVGLIHLPTPTTTHYSYTSHCDIMPTLFDYLGLYDQVAKLMVGKSLLRFDSSKNYALSGIGILQNRRGRKFALLAEGRKVIFTTPGAVVPSEIVADSDSPVSLDKQVASESIRLLDRYLLDQFLPLG